MESWRIITTDKENALSVPPFSLSKEQKRKMLNERLRYLTALHYEKCIEYRRIIDALGIDPIGVDTYYDIPFIPVSLFKMMDLLSVERPNIFKTMTSSGTTGQAVSRIYLDKETASNQQKALVKIVSEFTGSSRMPMLIIDSPEVVKDRTIFSARGAGIIGFSIFGTDKTYALNNDMSINFSVVREFLEKHSDRAILLFGFTFIVWHHFLKELLKSSHSIDLAKGILIHGGGWKKLTGEAVTRDEFKQQLRTVCGLRRVHDYYGMVEQTGSIYMECEKGHLHASSFSDIIIRRYMDFSLCGIGESGIVQVVSTLPESYPGHSLLTEDEGVLLGEDDCACGRMGKYFEIFGRLENAEIRGCSDTYAAGLQ